MIYFASNLAFLRNREEISLNDFSRKLNIPVERLQAFETGANEPGLAELTTISSELKLPIDVLLLRDLHKSILFNKDLNIKFLVMDVDGVLTDGGMYYTEGGDEFKKFNVKDGRALRNLSASGFEIGIISSGFNSNIIRKRAELFKIRRIYTGTEDKLKKLEEWCKELEITLEHVAFIGDDINDLNVIKQCGLSACPSDASDSIKSEVDVLLQAKGGEGCVREFIENYILKII